MAAKPEKNISNTLELNGTLYKTSGNIVFRQNSDESPYFLAQSQIDEMEAFLRNGMQMFLKKIKT